MRNRREDESAGRRSGDRSQKSLSPLTDEDAEEIRSVTIDLRHWLLARKLRFWLFVSMVLVVIGGTAALSVAVVRNVNRIDASQKQQLRFQRGANYRVCVRQNVTRAELQVAAADRTGDRRIFVARQHRVPVFDCLPLLGGARSPQPLEVDQQNRFIRFFAATCRAARVSRFGRVTTTPDPEDGQASVVCLPTTLRLPSG